MSRTDTASRHVRSDPASVYAALTDPDPLMRWLPPEGMTGRVEHFDARPGGFYRYVLTYPPGSTGHGKTTADTDVIEGRFVELVPGDRVVQTVNFVGDDPAAAGTMSMTWQLTEVDDGTHVEVRADDVPAAVTAEAHATGLASSLANLAALLETAGPTG